MKKILLPAIILLLSIENSSAQLSVAAQTIYDSCNVHNPGNVSYALTNGVQVISTPDSSTFYLQWFPTGATPNTTPLLVTLHGSKGNAFNEFKNWHTTLQLHNCGIIALQYNKYTDIYDFSNGYFHDDSIYSYIDSALTKINYPSNKALLHGFSLGSARTYAVIYNDIQSGKNYFCTTISNAGKIDLTYPFYSFINTIPNVFLGKHWNLFCGPPEPPYTGGACDGQDFTQTWLQSKGAIVDIYIQDSLLGHNGFNIPSSSSYRDTMINKYLECYNNVSAIHENTKLNKTTVFPNPFSSQTTLQSNNYLSNATLTIYDIYGQAVRQINNISGQTINLQRDDLKIGLYFLHLTQDNKLIETEELIITD